MSKVTVLRCLAGLMLVIAFAYWLRPPLVNSYLSLGRAIDDIILVSSASFAISLSVFSLVLEYVEKKKRKSKSE